MLCHGNASRGIADPVSERVEALERRLAGNEHIPVGQACLGIGALQQGVITLCEFLVAHIFKDIR